MISFFLFAIITIANQLQHRSTKSSTASIHLNLYSYVHIALHNRGANVDKASHNGNTPLIKAASVGALNAVKVLLNEGANINYQGTVQYPFLCMSSLFIFTYVRHLCTTLHNTSSYH